LEPTAPLPAQLQEALHHRQGWISQAVLICQLVHQSLAAQAWSDAHQVLAAKVLPITHGRLPHAPHGATRTSNSEPSKSKSLLAPGL
jgi:hypothetical protein